MIKITVIIFINFLFHLYFKLINFINNKIKKGIIPRIQNIKLTLIKANKH